MQGMNILAYFENSYITTVKSFITLAPVFPGTPVAGFVKLFTGVNIFGNFMEKIIIEKKERQRTKLNMEIERERERKREREREREREQE